MRKTCEHCGRQIVSYPVSDKMCVGGGPAIRLVRGWCCHECNEYDENGLLPEEAATCCSGTGPLEEGLYVLKIPRMGCGPLIMEIDVEELHDDFRLTWCDGTEALYSEYKNILRHYEFRKQIP